VKNKAQKKGRSCEKNQRKVHEVKEPDNELFSVIVLETSNKLSLQANSPGINSEALV
jgi:hypothetical protein